MNQPPTTKTVSPTKSVFIIGLTVPILIAIVLIVTQVFSTTVDSLSEKIRMHQARRANLNEFLIVLNECKKKVNQIEAPEQRIKHICSCGYTGSWANTAGLSLGNFDAASKYTKKFRREMDKKYPEANILERCKEKDKRNSEVY